MNEENMSEESLSEESLSEESLSEGAIAESVLSYIVRSIVNQPDLVVISVSDGQRGPRYEVQVGDGDMGRVIGRRGRSRSYPHCCKSCRSHRRTKNRGRVRRLARHAD